jgi:hypothetical protein
MDNLFAKLQALGAKAADECTENQKEMLDSLAARFGPAAAHGVAIATHVRAAVSAHERVALTLLTLGTFPEGIAAKMREALATNQGGARWAQNHLLQLIGGLSTGLDPATHANECREFIQLAERILGRLDESLNRAEAQARTMMREQGDGHANP